VEPVASRQLEAQPPSAPAPVGERDVGTLEARLADAQRLIDTYVQLIHSLEAKLATAAAQLADAIAQGERQAGQIRAFEAREAAAASHVADARAQSERRLEQIRTLEAQAANVAAHLADAEAQNARYAEQIRAGEALLAGAESRLSDAQGLNHAYEQTIFRLEAKLAAAEARLADAAREVSQPQARSPSASALDEHGQPLFRPLPLPQRQVAFLHVPKCGGTALALYLQEAMQPCRVVNNVEFLGGCDASYVRTLDLVHGHFSMTEVAKLRPDCFLFTMFREPVDRLLSFYGSVRSGTSGLEAKYPALVAAAGTLSFEQFVESEDPQVSRWTRNPVTRQLSGELPARSQEHAAQMSTEEALARLEEFDYIGVYEDFTTSINILQLFFNWPIVDRLPGVNVTPVRIGRAELSAAVAEKVTALNATDAALYEHARRHHKRVASALEPLIAGRRNLRAARLRWAAP
jgi:hypothetical protein